MGGITTIITTVIIYMLVVAAIGIYSFRVSKATAEDYLIAGRSLGLFVLLIGIYATNMSSFGIVGYPIIAYEQGIGAFGYAPAAMWLAPIAFYVFCHRSWILGKRFGYMTPAEILSERTGSELTGTVLFIIYAIYTVPYLMTGLVGGGVIFSSMTNGVVPYWLGAFIPYIVVLFYVMLGGMRGQMWTNVFQGCVFLFMMVVGTAIIFSKMGGTVHVFETLRAEAPHLLQLKGNFDMRTWSSYVLITFPAVATYPWMYIRVMSSRSDKVMRQTFVLYPLIYVIGWLPPVLIALAGVIVFPGLTGVALDDIIPMMFTKFFPPWALGFALAAILAAMMSTLDAQLLTLSTMLTRDILVKKTDLTDKQQVLYGRIFVFVLATIGYILTLIRPGTIFQIFNFAATGFIGLAPVLFAMLYWKRFNRYGAIASMLASVLSTWLYLGNILPPEAALGFIPMLPVLVISAVVLVVVTYLTPPEKMEVTNRFFKVFERVYTPFVNSKARSKQVSG
ncbi:MAG: sodium:solute symporter family protein [Firmicutes bacterium]|nr:sodium:solute symporter family protein [Bacillota bacterium]